MEVRTGQDISKNLQISSKSGNYANLQDLIEYLEFASGIDLKKGDVTQNVRYIIAYKLTQKE